MGKNLATPIYYLLNMYIVVHCTYILHSCYRFSCIRFRVFEPKSETQMKFAIQKLNSPHVLCISRTLKNKGVNCGELDSYFFAVKRAVKLKQKCNEGILNTEYRIGEILSAQ